jgi:glycyl-tRNA synthetase
MYDLEKIVSLCKRRGYIFQSSEIYGGIGGCWDYGPLGVELKRNIKEAWWQDIVHRRDNMVGLDAAIIMNPQTWVASGHVETFGDMMVDCKSCKRRFRADQLQSDKCPECGGELTESRKFNTMFKTYMGPVEEEAAIVYLRPETAQGIFVNFINVQETMRKKLPFGIAQIGKVFRNEITTGNFIFRDREFEQMEIEFFVKPGTDEEWHKYWVNERLQWYIKYGIKRENLRTREHEKDELAHYAKACVDIEYPFPMGWSEIEGIANRIDFDLSQHQKFSKKDLTYFDDETKERYIPYVIEPSAGVDRPLLTFLYDAYHEEEVRGQTRAVLKLHKDLAPVKVAVFPLLRNRAEIVELATKIADGLKKKFVAMYDDTASIGKLYRRQDEIGTLYCITVDVQSLEDKQVTIRDRDTMEQIRVPVENVEQVIAEKLITK